jgi:hypothetical protein
VDGLIERGEASPRSVIKAIQEAAVGHPVLASVVERPQVIIFLDKVFVFGYL